jgi:hypothetical protein
MTPIAPGLPSEGAAASDPRDTLQASETQRVRMWLRPRMGAFRATHLWCQHVPDLPGTAEAVKCFHAKTFYLT